MFVLVFLQFLLFISAMKHIALFVVVQLASLLSLAAADWKTTKWDAIVVGAGPAGIIGCYPASLLNSLTNKT